MKKNIKNPSSFFLPAPAMFLCCLLMFSVACTKEDKLQGTASLAIFNGIQGTNTLVPNFRGTTPLDSYLNARKLLYGITQANTMNSGFGVYFPFYTGKQPLSIFNYPDTTVHSQPLISLQPDLQAGTMNTLFLTGTIDAPDTLLSRDYPPYHSSSDSSMGLRFVNLSPGGLQISVNLQGESNGSEVSKLPYKNITGFKNYAADLAAAAAPYVFEIRNGTNNNLLATHTVNVSDVAEGLNILNKYRFRNFTLVVFGVPGNAAPFGLRTVLMNNY